MVVGQIADKAVKFLVDTGSAVTIISKNVADTLKTPLPLVHTDIDLCTADGNNLPVDGEGLYWKSLWDL